MSKRKQKQADRINPNLIPTRDRLLEALINGATKSGIHTDRRKEANKKKCRKPVQENDE